jgi:hypothetical protein
MIVKFGANLQNGARSGSGSGPHSEAGSTFRSRIRISIKRANLMLSGSETLTGVNIANHGKRGGGGGGTNLVEEEENMGSNQNIDASSISL